MSHSHALIFHYHSKPQPSKKASQYQFRPSSAAAAADAAAASREKQRRLKVSLRELDDDRLPPAFTYRFTLKIARATHYSSRLLRTLRAAPSASSRAFSFSIYQGLFLHDTLPRRDHLFLQCRSLWRRCRFEALTLTLKLSRRPARPNGSSYDKGFSLRATPICRAFLAPSAILTKTAE